VKFERGLNWHGHLPNGFFFFFCLVELSCFIRSEVSITNVDALIFASHFGEIRIEISIKTAVQFHGPAISDPTNTCWP